MFRALYILFASLIAGLLYLLWSSGHVAWPINILCTSVIGGLLYLLSSPTNGQSIQGGKWLLFLASSLIPIFILQLIAKIFAYGNLFGYYDASKFMSDHYDIFMYGLGYMLLSWGLCVLRILWLAVKQAAMLCYIHMK